MATPSKGPREYDNPSVSKERPVATEAPSWMKLKDAVVGGRCPFCHVLLGETIDKPENLAFLKHIEQKPDCRKSFEAWRTNTQSDAGGD